MFFQGIFISTGGDDKLIPRTDDEISTDVDHERKKSIFSKSTFWKFVSESKANNQSSAIFDKSLGKSFPEYFKIHVNEYHVVDNIVCFTKKVIFDKFCCSSENITLYPTENRR